MTRYIFPVLLAMTIFFACNKNSNNYSTTDHTVGMLASHQWAGNSNGYSLGDTLLPLATVHTAWPRHFNRNISDTAVAVSKINGFEIAVFGATMQYRNTDSVTEKYVMYDSVITGTLTARLYFYYLRDSMMFILDRVDSCSAAANQCYELHDSLHTKHS